ncbi:hypothetical protein [Streptomyces peucetius]|uniref:Uncharacterized protein n=1 Tax=Streptomyces peucetius TaxID=1950 RepID=A0ABY6HZS4_STRPE|nr:hypothetical protein OGH68_01090 [Streptomyces peucetius]
MLAPARPDLAAYLTDSLQEGTTGDRVGARQGAGVACDDSRGNS